MKVLIRSMTGEVFSLEIELSDLIERVKENIQEMTKLPLRNQKLLYDQTCLKDENTVEFYNIRENSLLFLSFKLERNIQIFVRTSKDKLLSFIVETFHTIESVKNKIQRLNNKNPEGQKLLFRGEELEDKQTLGSYNIKNNSILLLLDRNTQIFIRVPTGTIISLDVDLSDTISKLKEEIQRYQGFSPDNQILSYSEEELEEQRSLASCNLQKNSILDLAVMGIGGNKRIYISNFAETILTLHVKSFHTIKYLKTLIQEKRGVPVEEQKIAFAGTILEDERVIADYNIQTESTIYVVSNNSSESDDPENLFAWD